MELYGLTDVGKVRSENQDTFCCEKLSDTLLYAVVCDGMGGASGGSVASRIAADTVSKRIQTQYRANMPQTSVFRLLESAVAAANIEVFDKAADDATLTGMGTTLVAVVIDGEEVTVAHVGDSRLYAVDADGIRQITTDHSIVQEMLEKGQLTPEEARRHPRKHFITRAVGVESTVRVDFDTFSLQPGERLLLCTDGLTNMVSDDDICRLMQGDDAAALPECLIQAANVAGGEDNITAVVIA